MTRKVSSTTRKKRSLSELNKDDLKSMDIRFQGSHVIVGREKANPQSSQDRRRVERQTENKIKNDMHRRMLSVVQEAIDKKVVLPFRTTDFVRARDQGKIRVETGGSFPGSQCLESIHLKATDGARVVVDLDDIPIFWYFPALIGAGMQNILLHRAAEFIAALNPKSDEHTNDRRGNRTLDSGGPSGALDLDPGFRAETHPAGTDPPQGTEGSACGLSGSLLTQQVSRRPWRRSMIAHSGSAKAAEAGSTRQSTAEQVGVSSLKAISLRRQQVHTDEEQEEPGVGAKHTAETEDAAAHIMAELARRPACGIYLSPGWFPTGMHNVRMISPLYGMENNAFFYKHQPIQISQQFREALQRCLPTTLRFLKAKRLYDWQLERLTDIIHSSLSESMTEVRRYQGSVPGLEQTVLKHGWSSAFPCFGLGVNRASALHRDSKGIRGGLDIIGVIGTFAAGGDIALPDIKLTAELPPGSVDAFDGYDYRHKINAWSGGSRIALISFCRESTWSGLGLDSTLLPPKLTGVKERLQQAMDDRRQIAQALYVRRMEAQAEERASGAQS